MGGFHDSDKHAQQPMRPTAEMRCSTIYRAGMVVPVALIDDGKFLQDAMRRFSFLAEYQE